MKRKIIAALFLLSMMFSSFSASASTGAEVILPAVAVTSSGENWGYINESGTFVIKPSFASVSDFNDNGIAIAAEGKPYSDYYNVYFINKSGERVSGPFYSDIPQYNNGVAILNINPNGSVIVDETGKVILKSKYFLADYSDGLISFYDPTKKLSGLMDLTGKIVVPAKFSSIKGLADGKFIADINSEKYFIIDKTGNVQQKLDEGLYDISEGLGTYQDKSSSCYGYKTTDGAVAIKPQFSRANAFADGYAVVAIENNKDYSTKYGLIDKKGNYVMKPEYSGISYLGKGLYAVSQNFYSYNSDSFAAKAIFNSKGEKLTDYKYYRVNSFDGDYASACDNTTSFFIDTKGNIVESLPKLQGVGDMKCTGNIIKAELDGGLAYLKKNGDIIWQKSDTMPLNNNISVKQVKYRRDYLTYIEYPEISGIGDNKVQQSINTKLKEYFINGYESAGSKAKTDEEYYEDVSINYDASINKNLLIINKLGYLYPIGAAHGMPTKEYIYIDTKTGAFYKLKDLFKSNSKYTEKLTSIVNTQLTLNSKMAKISGGLDYFENSVKVSADQSFIISSDSIKVYYTPYEIAAYAAGFPQFEIPYGQLTGIIDTNGAFWNSFDKKIVSRKTLDVSDIGDSKIKSIEDLMGLYEKNIIEAVNNNNFSKVEACLQKGSSLYNSQKKLVQNLYQKNTKEKLNKYEIYAVDYNHDKNEYMVYVTEQTAVKYQGKSFVNMKYQWCYSVKADDSGNFKLCNIQKW